jgi:hypothetical protein
MEERGWAPRRPDWDLEPTVPKPEAPRPEAGPPEPGWLGRAPAAGAAPARSGAGDGWRVAAYVPEPGHPPPPAADDLASTGVLW